MTWVEVPSGSDFPIENLPYGALSTDNGHPRIGVAIGDRVLDLAPVLDDATFAEPTLNRFVAQGRPRWQEVRAQITELLSEDRHRPVVEPHLVPQESVTLHLPFEAGDYVDYYASEDHASNLGRMLVRVCRADGVTRVSLAAALTLRSPSSASSAISKFRLKFASSKRSIGTVAYAYFW